MLLRDKANSLIARTQRQTRRTLSSVGIMTPQHLLPSDEWSIDLPWFINRTGYGLNALDPGYGEHQFYTKVLCERYKHVFGIDIAEVKSIKAPNFEVFRIDLFDYLRQAPRNFFDLVISHSFLEHAGLGFYGDTIVAAGDDELMEGYYRTLKPGGTLLIQVPYGKAKRIIRHEGKPFYRIYNSLDTFASGFILKEVSFARFGTLVASWKETEYSFAKQIDWADGFAQCIVRIKAVKA